MNNQVIYSFFVYILILLNILIFQNPRKIKKNFNVFELFFFFKILSNERNVKNFRFDFVTRFYTTLLNFQHD